MFRWLVSVALLALPIVTTFGVLLNWAAINHAGGRPLPFSEHGGTDGLTPSADFVEMRCDESFGITSISKGNQEFSINANPWGWQKGQPGAICILVNKFGNETNATAHGAPPVFNVTWQYTKASGTQNVRAYPNALVKNKNLPVQLGRINKFELDVEWHFSSKNDSVVEISRDHAIEKDVSANVAIDMFLDKEASKSGSSEKAAFEVMVWFADYGKTAWPIGKHSVDDRGESAVKLNGTEFRLFTGRNTNTKREQLVFTWLATQNTNKFNGSLLPLMNAIFAKGNATWPQKTDYLGHFAFGQEAYQSSENVTFSVPQLVVDIESS
ncbi:hypothetical protein QQS21_006460 [Conoideocrella luteorostrata]|uniref:Uncharacterized protein n=1 Tax=Conoideocrella luteorostrata TaxID=1105319 RepID=A0AAJ0G065_9HYPO|nr:hypothetical protein QQS21_006460 [Conoideocrella luteorostrata]